MGGIYVVHLNEGKMGVDINGGGGSKNEKGIPLQNTTVIIIL